MYGLNNLHRKRLIKYPERKKKNQKNKNNLVNVFLVRVIFNTHATKMEIPNSVLIANIFIAVGILRSTVVC